MTAHHGTCPGCQRAGRRLQHGFCQRCVGSIPVEKRAVILDIQWRERALALNVRKLEANARHEESTVAGIRASIAQLRARFGDGESLRLFEAAIPCWVESLTRERPVLIGRIARQRAAIDVLRKKHGVAR